MTIWQVQVEELRAFLLPLGWELIEGKLSGEKVIVIAQRARPSEWTDEDLPGMR